jgi:hypothetical protein
MRKTIKETNVVGPKGDVLISTGLKVRHKGSGFEYTVDDVVPGEDNELVILLNPPETPRFDPPKSRGNVLKQSHKGNVMYEYDVNRDSSFFVPEKGGDIEPDTLAVPKEEFEKEYEVV